MNVAPSGLPIRLSLLPVSTANEMAFGLKTGKSEEALEALFDEMEVFRRNN